MSRNISPLVNTDTVEEWFGKTNLLIDMAEDTVTLGDGEINTGNIVLNGNMSAIELSANALNVTDELLDTIQVNAGAIFNTAKEFSLSLNNAGTPNADGQKISFEFQNSARWTMGVVNADFSSFAIKNNDLNYDVTLTTNETGQGTLSGTNLVIDRDILPAAIDSNTTGNAATCGKWTVARTVRFATGDVTGEFVIDGSQNIENIVLNVADNSHRHAISNVEGLQEALNAKQTTDPALESVTNLGDQFGILVRTSVNKIEPKVITPGDGIAIINGGGVGGTPTIAHADTSSASSPENSGATFIQNIGFDGFGHVTQVQSEPVPVSSTYVSAERDLQGGASASIPHGLGARPFLVEGVLICKDSDLGYSVGDMIPLSGCDTSDITVFASATNIGFRCKNIIEIRLVNTQGQLTALNNTKWKLVIKGVL